mmetsp:Transcript_11483/g.26720  ORF Transcript_11483/g.26720 Transcript_11483/m.26720 type:complete len:240 (+) Transcript_11483:1776-2495(+)
MGDPSSTDTLTGSCAHTSPQTTRGTPPHSSHAGYRPTGNTKGPPRITWSLSPCCTTPTHPCRTVALSTTAWRAGTMAGVTHGRGGMSSGAVKWSVQRWLLSSCTMAATTWALEETLSMVIATSGRDERDGINVGVTRSTPSPSPIVAPRPESLPAANTYALSADLQKDTSVPVVTASMPPPATLARVGLSSLSPTPSWPRRFPPRAKLALPESSRTCSELHADARRVGSELNGKEPTLG